MGVRAVKRIKSMPARPGCHLARFLSSINPAHVMQVPSQLQKLFEKNLDLLLSIFNPEGWLDITFVDDQHRIGRDDKGNVFLLERC